MYNLLKFLTLSVIFQKASKQEAMTILINAEGMLMVCDNCFILTTT
jgi:hypothetical protein